MEPEVDKKYVLEDIMKRRKRDQEAIENKIKNKLALKVKRAKKKDAIKAPEKFVKQYRASQRSYSYLKKRSNQIAHSRITKST